MTTSTTTIVLVFAAFAALLAAFALSSGYLRQRVKQEGFLGEVPAELFIPKVAPGGFTEVSPLSPGPAMNSTTEQIIQAPGLPAMTAEEARSHWGELSSERCYRADIGESLKKTRNFLQRTNNYQRTHPDDCSAPNHEFIGTFYKPVDGVGRYPEAGTDAPPSTARCPLTD
jgi:hypothetical protein